MPRVKWNPRKILSSNPFISINNGRRISALYVAPVRDLPARGLHCKTVRKCRSVYRACAEQFEFTARISSMSPLAARCRQRGAFIKLKKTLMHMWNDGKLKWPNKNNVRSQIEKYHLNDRKRWANVFQVGSIIRRWKSSWLSGKRRQLMRDCMTTTRTK